MVLNEPDDPSTEEPELATLKHVKGRWRVDEIKTLARRAPQQPIHQGRSTVGRLARRLRELG